MAVASCEMQGLGVIGMIAMASSQWGTLDQRPMSGQSQG
jgi:hypothetical protein